MSHKEKEGIITGEKPDRVHSQDQFLQGNIYTDCEGQYIKFEVAQHAWCSRSSSPAACPASYGK